MSYARYGTTKRFYVNPGELRTKIKCYAKTTTYVPGQGQTSTWEPSGDFNCKWTGSYGARVMEAQALGVSDSATVTMRFAAALYAKLRTEQVVVIKNADPTAIVDGKPDKNNPNVYELWGGVDNAKEENRYMEFRVRRYEGW
jgi:hypothetical protein